VTRTLFREEIMEDVDPVEEFRPGHTIDEIQIRLELYRLITMILASGPIAEKALDWHSTLKDGARYHTHYLQGLAERYFDDELSRILIYTAIQGRVYSSMKYPGSFPIWSEHCGELETGSKCGVPLGEGPLCRKTVPLTLREAFNKIIHATVLDTDTEAVSHPESYATTNRINPLVYLYGTHVNGKPWRATLNLMDFVRLMNQALPRCD
jgi:hypothetical protein